jgi:hypothetical protein
VWRSDNLYERLGLSDRAADATVIKRHFHILAKHYHPDRWQGVGGDKDAAEAFRRIREAYEVLSEAQTREQYDRDGSEYFTRRDTNFYSTTVDPRRIAFLRLLRPALPLFFFGVIVACVVVVRRNKALFQATFISHLLMIFAIIQIFPRVLAAIILFAFHTSSLGEILSLSERASASVVITEREDNFTARVDGLSAASQSNAEKLLTVFDFTLTAQDGTTNVSSTQFRNRGAPITVPRIPGASYRLTVVDEQRGIKVAESFFTLGDS